MTRIRSSEGEGNCGKLVLTLNEHAIILWKLGAEKLHDRGPRSDGVSSAEAATACDQTERNHGVAIGGDAISCIIFARSHWHVLDVVDGPGITGVESEHCIAQNILRFSAKFLSDDCGHFLAV